MESMNDPAPLTFTDEQLLAALKAAPGQVQAQVSLIAMQIELHERRAADDEPEDENA